MSMSPEGNDKWIFVAALCLLGTVFLWQLMNTPEPESKPSFTPFKHVNKQRPIFEATANGLYSTDELTYFTEIAFGSEHGKIPPGIYKWTDNIHIRIDGDPTAEDLLTLKKTIELLNKLQDEIRLSIGYFETSLVIHFAPEKTFTRLHSKYSGRNPGFFWVGWVEHVIYRGSILIDSDTTQAKRNSLITEELTQALGLMNVSSRHRDSIFNDDRIIPGLTLSDLDKTLVTMLYRSEIKPGMPEQEAMTTLAGITAHPDPTSKTKTVVEIETEIQADEPEIEKR